MTQKEIYCMGRAEYEGYFLTEDYAIAEREWKTRNGK